MLKLKSALIFLFLVVNASTTPCQTSVDSSRIIRVLTFNILHGATTKGDFDLDVIARVIKGNDPDFVALQEVDFMTNRNRKQDLATELGHCTQLIPLFGRAIHFDTGEYGVGILSKYTLLTSRNVALPYTQGNEARTALELVTTINSKDTIAFISTHLDQGRDEKDRTNQVKKINKMVALNRYPTILAGDLNAQPGSKPINLLEEIWMASYSKNNPSLTYPSNNPSRQIDYVMLYPKNRWKVLETKVIQDSIASDHCAYLVVVELLDVSNMK